MGDLLGIVLRALSQFRTTIELIQLWESIAAALYDTVAPCGRSILDANAVKWAILSDVFGRKVGWKVHRGAEKHRPAARLV
jgi:hypothetical protein